jgi:uncharacterized protein YkwD
MAAGSIPAANAEKSSTMTLRTLAGALALAAMTAVATALPAAAQSTSPEKTPAEKQAEISRLLSQFHAAAKEPQQRAGIVRKAVQAGSAAAKALMTAIQHEMAPDVRRYTAKFAQKADALAQKRINAAKPGEISKLRETVLGLRKAPNFTHETIEAKADPAMKRLREIFVVARQDVLDATPPLKEDRRKLTEAGKLWEQCAACVYQHMPKDEKESEEAPNFERYLRGEEELAALLAGPSDAATRNTLTANARLAAQLDREEGRAISALNLTRSLLGLPVLAIDVRLCDAAHDHCRDMKRLKFFAHDSPVEHKKTPWDRAKRMGTTASAENIAMGQPDGEAANMTWFHSPPHHANMLGGHRRVGMGHVGDLYTEMFGD